MQWALFNSLEWDQLSIKESSTTLSQKVYHPTTNDNFNNNFPILVIFGE